MGKKEERSEEETEEEEEFEGVTVKWREGNPYPPQTHCKILTLSVRGSGHLILPVDPSLNLGERERLKDCFDDEDDGEDDGEDDANRVYVEVTGGKILEGIVNHPLDADRGGSKGTIGVFVIIYEPGASCSVNCCGMSFWLDGTATLEEEEGAWYPDRISSSIAWLMERLNIYQMWAVVDQYVQYVKGVMNESNDYIVVTAAIGTYEDFVKGAASLWGGRSTPSARLMHDMYLKFQERRTALEYEFKSIRRAAGSSSVPLE